MKTHLNLKPINFEDYIKDPIEYNYLHYYFDITTQEGYHIVPIFVANDNNFNNEMSATIRLNIKYKDDVYSLTYPSGPVKFKNTSYGWSLIQGESKIDVYGTTTIKKIKIKVNLEDIIKLNAYFRPRAPGFKFNDDGVCASDGKNIFGGIVVAPYCDVNGELSIKNNKISINNAIGYHDMTLGSILSANEWFWIRGLYKNKVISVAKVINQPFYNKLGDWFQYLYIYDLKTKKLVLTDDFVMDVKDYIKISKLKMPSKILIENSEKYMIRIKDILEKFGPTYIRASAVINNDSNIFSTCEYLKIPRGKILTFITKLILKSEVKKEVKKTKEFLSQARNQLKN